MDEKLNTYDYLILTAFTLILNYYWVANSQLCVIESSPLLTFINHYHNNKLYGDSILIKGLENYYTYYFKTAGALSDYVSVKTVISLLTLLPGLLMVPTIFLIGYMASDSNKYVGYLTVMMALTNWQLQAALGGSESFGSGLTHVAFASSFLTLSFALFLKNYRWLAFIIVGIMINIHAPLALSVLMILFACSLVSHQVDFKKVAAWLSMSIMAGAPTFFWYFNGADSATNNAIVPLEEWHLLNRLRSSHSLPFNWNLGVYLNFNAFWINIFLFPSIKNKMPHQIMKYFLATIIAISIMCVVGLVFVEFYNVLLVEQLCLFRSTRFLLIISIAILASYVVTKVRSGEGRKIESIIAILIMISLITWNLKIAMILEIIIFGWLYLKHRLIAYLFPFVSMLAFCLVGIFFVQKKHIFPLFDDITLFYLVAGTALIFWTAILLKPKLASRFPPVGVVIIFILLAIMGSFDAYSIHQKELLNAMKETQIWISNNTSVESKFLIPPNMALWENYSKRSNYLNCIDLAFAFYNPGLIVEIMKKLENYGVDLRTFKYPKDLFDGMYTKYYNWDDDYIKSLAKTNNISVMVVESERGKKYEFPLIHENRYFRVYSLK